MKTYILVLALSLLSATTFAAEATLDEKTRAFHGALTEVLAMTNHMSYDALSRLTNVVYGNGYSESYTYDPAGNRTSRRNGLDPKMAWDWEWRRATNQWVLTNKSGKLETNFLQRFYNGLMANKNFASYPGVTNVFMLRYQEELKKLSPP